VDDARRAVADRTELAADPGTPLDREQLGVAYHNLGMELTNNAQWAEAEDWYRAALAAWDRLAADSPTLADTPAFRASRGGTLNNLGILRARAGDTTAAEKLFREAAGLRTRLADDFPENPDYASDLGRTLEWLGGMLRDLKQFDESVRVFRESVRRQGIALGLRPKDPVFRDLCCKHQAQVADTFLRMNRSVDAAVAALKLPRLAPDDPAVLLRASCLFANCAALAQKDHGFPWGLGWVLTRVYQRQAVALVRQAVAKGLGDATRVLADPVYDPVRGCEEFRVLFHEVNVPRQ
jgi:tetratricopeptide (TPR) repeat protein